jgi:hypothetical protein
VEVRHINRSSSATRHPKVYTRSQIAGANVPEPNLSSNVQRDRPFTPRA